MSATVETLAVPRQFLRDVKEWVAQIRKRSKTAFMEWRHVRQRQYVKSLETEVARLKRRDARSAATLQSSHDAGMYWAQRATTSITWNVILWHVRQRVTKKRREFDPLTKFVDKPTEEEALEVLREMWRNPPVFAPPEEARALAERIATLHTEQSRMKPQGVSR